MTKWLVKEIAELTEKYLVYQDVQAIEGIRETTYWLMMGLTG